MKTRFEFDSIPPFSESQAHPSIEVIYECEEGNVDGNLKLKLIEHVSFCPICNAHLESIQIYRAEVSDHKSDYFDFLNDNKELTIHKLKGDSRSRTIPILLSAAIAATILLLFFMNLNNNSNLYPYIQEQHQRISSLKTSETGLIENEDDIYEIEVQIIDYFNNENYGELINYISLTGKNPNPLESFYIGLAALQVDPPNLTLAELSFKSTSKSNLSFKTDAQFYLAQIELLRENFDLCHEIINKMERRHPDYPGLKQLKKTLNTQMK